MAWDTADDDLANELVAFITEEAQSFSCLVAVLVQGLVTIIRNSGVWTRVIFHCSGQIENTPVMLKGIFFKKHAAAEELRTRTYRHTLGYGHSIWVFRYLGHGRRSGSDPRAGSPRCMRNGPPFQQRSLLRGALSVLRSQPPLDQDTVGLWKRNRDTQVAFNFQF